MAFAWLGERLSASRILGLAIGFSGVVVLVWDKASMAAAGAGWAFAAALGAAFLYGLGANYSRRYLAGLDSLTVAAGGQIAAVLVLAPLAAFALPPALPSAAAWVSVIALGVVATGAAHVYYFRLIASVGATAAIAVTFLIPVFGMLCGSKPAGTMPPRAPVTSRLLILDLTLADAHYWCAHHNCCNNGTAVRRIREESMKKMHRYWALASILLLGAAFSCIPEAAAAEPPKLDSANTAWMLTSAVLVLFMTLPGLALFYAGLVRMKNALSVLMQCFAITCIVTLAWVAVGYSLAFGDAGALNAWYGGFDKAFLAGIDVKTVKGTIPETVFAMYQMTFAIITPALVIGAYAERVRFSGMLLFSLLWLILVYCPVAHWVWGDGWLQKMGLMDFAGGTVVHLNAGMAALVCATALGRRRGFPETPMPPHNMTMTVTGACMLWVGWFGFNAGSALAADGAAGMAMLVTHVGAATGAFAWMVCEWARYGKPSVLGIVTGMVAGLGTITPASGFVGPMGALAIGGIAGVVCFFATSYMKQALKVDDSLDVFPVHGVGGIIGTIMTGIFVASAFGGIGYPEKVTMGDQVLVQITGVLAVGAWSGVITWVLLKVSDAVAGMRLESEEENEGLDTVLHNEKGYDL